jgi:nicotinamidase-related amidase
MNKQLNAQLLIIDPQNDFCDLPDQLRPELREGGRLAPALPVTGAHRDMQRIAALIERCGAALSGITVTLDAHQHIDIGHPTFWQMSNGGPVPPFTQVSHDDVVRGVVVPRLHGALPRVLHYLEALEAAGRYRHMIWPVHCEIGTWGQAVHPRLRQAYNGWEEQTLRTVAKVTKGENPWTEHYSAIRAEVPDARDPATDTNQALVAQLAAADRLYITGEAGSHCVKATTEHLVAALDPARLGKLTLVTDCMSAVTGFERVYEDFLRDMQARGLRLAIAEQVEQEIRSSAPVEERGA